MNVTMMLSIVSIIYIFILTIIYFLKGNIKNPETKLYSIILPVILVGGGLELSLRFLAPHMDNLKWLNDIVSKLFLIYLVFWLSLITLYNVYISFSNKKYKKFKTFIIIYNLISYFFVGILPIKYHYDNGMNYYSYTYGPACDFLKICLLSLVFINLVVLILNYKDIFSNKKYYPIIIFEMLFIITGIIQINYPEILLNIFIESLVAFIMYNTIENPDTRLIEQLNIAKDQAEKANHAKTEFLSSMSHEIRTPLNAIDGFSQLILEEKNINVIKDEARDIMMASQNLLEIVNGILDISKIEANKLEIVKVEYEPKKIFDELVKLTKARIGDRPLEFRVNIASDLPEYLNVCRLIVSVKDSGIGIKKDNIEKLFSKFERFDMDKNMTIEGTGLGLAITKKLVDLMQAKIVVDSVYGKGSNFTVAIDQRIVNKAKVVVPEVKESKILNVKGKKILIVDDNLINLKVASRLLSTYKVETEEVSSGFDCIKKIEDGNKYDLILLDDMMPKMSGVETFKKLKEMKDFNTPVVALTANAIAGMKENYLKEGFNDYISKPIDKKELERVLKTYLNAK